jgi:hypothetical protein
MQKAKEEMEKKQKEKEQRELKKKEMEMKHEMKKLKKLAEEHQKHLQTQKTRFVPTFDERMQKYKEWKLMQKAKQQMVQNPAGEVTTSQLRRFKRREELKRMQQRQSRKEELLQKRIDAQIAKEKEAANYVRW